MIITISELTKLRPKLANVVLAGGVFDFVHGGHIDHLREAKSHGDHLIVHITSDKRVREKKGSNRPILDEHERAGIIAAIRFVDAVFIADLPHYHPDIVNALQPDVLFVNKESIPDGVVPEVGFAHSTRIVVSDAPKRNNSSRIIAALRRGQKSGKQRRS